MLGLAHAAQCMRVQFERGLCMLVFCGAEGMEGMAGRGRAGIERVA